MSDKFPRQHVKVFVYTESLDGYPAEEWEGIWALQLEDGHFQIDNIPFYARNLSCDDIVEAAQDGGNYIFKGVVNPSDNSTIRAVVYDLGDEASVRRDLINLGCSIEGTGTPGMIAINVPKKSVEQVVAFLNRAFADEKLDFEEGVLR
ncbi:MAG: DUF4265 domain-containing protein [Alphaproteobacteria bacterium]|nr:DUF4265 domain-containing protein [Alphaproteobacteria bacterium]MBV9372438.1 DUF4265 domain-containing protein [Alphaproteobacteria bacterium]MBV9902113.1 DUF4265 domain-containing protein [Alphaproteobacteria bacterium]